MENNWEGKITIKVLFFYNTQWGKGTFYQQQQQQQHIMLRGCNTFA